MVPKNALLAFINVPPANQNTQSPQVTRQNRAKHKSISPVRGFLEITAKAA
jgi:hypothetical protein